MPKSAAKAKRSSPSQPTARPRRLQAPRRVWYRPLSWYQPSLLPARRPLPAAWTLFRLVLRQLWRDKRLFGGIVLIYGALNILLVRGVAGSSDLQDFKTTLDSVFHGVGGHLTSASLTFASLLASSGSGNTANSGMYQVILLLICSLAFIWALRQVIAKHQARVRDSFYRGMYPLVPFMLVLLLAGIQLVPLAVGSGLYATVTSGGIAVHFWERALWLLLFIGLAVWSLRLITASLFALYIVTLPDMTPLAAYRSARQLVQGRRLLIWRKLLFLPLILLLLAVLIELPLILLLTPLAVWVFFIVSMLALPLVHGYLYNLYRELL